MTLEEIGHVAPEMDLHPEYYAYQDEGCELSPSCLQCPRPQCALDECGGIAGVLRNQRDNRIVDQADKGKNTRQLAEAFELSKRTVQRILKQDRDSQFNYVSEEF